MTLRGQAAIVGFAEVPSRRAFAGRSTLSMCGEIGRQAMEDAGLRKDQVDGLITRGETIDAMKLAEQIGLRLNFCDGVTMHGANGAYSIALAASAISSGLATTVLCVFGGTREKTIGGVETGEARTSAPTRTTEFEDPYGPPPGRNGNYGLMKQRYMYQYGVTDAQFAKIAVDQRFNALDNENAAFAGQPLTISDVLESRYVCEPLHLYECVMNCDGGAACIVVSADRAKSFPHPPVYLLGAGVGATWHDAVWQTPDPTVTPVTVTARRAYEMAQYSAADMQFAQLYDCYTVTVAATLEDAGFCRKGEAGEFYESTDTTYKGSFPINTDGGQLSGGQPVNGAGGFRHVVEAARQLMGRAGGRQVPQHDLCLVNGNGGTASIESTLVLGTADTL